MSRGSKLVLAILGVASGPIGGPLAAQTPAAVPRIVEVEGRSVRVLTAGLEDRELDSPVVVFESGGGGDPVEVWDPVLEEVAGFAPVVAYERAGIGGSEPDTARPTLERINQNLRALLREIGAEPPYVLVGHSFGGPLIRSFAGRHPDEVAGLVYVDAGGLTRTDAEELAVFESIGAGKAERREYRETLEAFVERMPRGPRTEIETIVMELRSRPGLPPHPDVPVAVILAGRYDPPPPGVHLPFDFAAYHEANVRHEVRRLSEWVLEAPGGMFVLAKDAGHYVHQDNPELVVEAIRGVTSHSGSNRARVETLASPGEADTASIARPSRFDRRAEHRPARVVDHDLP